jgi:hypothetical protein
MPTIDRRKEMNEGLAQDIKDIKKMLSDHLLLEAAREEREKTMRTEVDKLKEAVHGNGKPGLKTDVQLLQESEKKRAAFQNAIATAVIIQIILTLVLKVF